MMVSYNTPLETIEALKAKLRAYVNTNSRDWSGFDLNIDKMVNQNAIHLIVAMERTCIPGPIELVLNSFSARSTELAGLGREMG